MTAVTILILAIIAYVSVLTASLLLSQPLRYRVQEIGSDILEQPTLSKEERVQVTWLMESCASSSVGMMIPVAAFFMVASGLLGARRKPNPGSARLRGTAAYESLCRYYILSIMACSPFAALASVPFILASVMIQAVRGDRHLLDAAEAPILRASATIQPA